MNAVNFRPLGDMILVKPDHVADRIGSIVIPQGVLAGADRPGDYHDSFIGTVVATGPGDQLVILECKKCRKTRTRILNKRNVRSGISVGKCECGESASEMVATGHAPMEVKVGDRVVLPRRPSMPGGEYSLTLEGETYVMFHEQQFAYGVVEA